MEIRRTYTLDEVQKILIKAVAAEKGITLTDPPGDDPRKVTSDVLITVTPDQKGVEQVEVVVNIEEPTAPTGA